jgi:hypothetical protein
MPATAPGPAGQRASPACRLRSSYGLTARGAALRLRAASEGAGEPLDMDALARRLSSEAAKLRMSYDGDQLGAEYRDSESLTSGSLAQVRAARAQHRRRGLAEGAVLDCAGDPPLPLRCAPQLIQLEQQLFKEIGPGFFDADDFEARPSCCDRRHGLGTAPARCRPAASPHAQPHCARSMPETCCQRFHTSPSPCAGGAAAWEDFGHAGGSPAPGQGHPCFLSGERPPGYARSIDV